MAFEQSGVQLVVQNISVFVSDVARANVSIGALQQSLNSASQAGNTFSSTAAPMQGALNNIASAASNTVAAANPLVDLFKIGFGAGLGVGVVQLFTNVINKLRMAIVNLTKRGLESLGVFQLLEFSFGALVAQDIRAITHTDDLAGSMQVATALAKEMVTWVNKLAVRSPFTPEAIADTLQMAAAFGFTLINVSDTERALGSLSISAQRVTKVFSDWGAAAGKTGDQISFAMRALGQVQQLGRLAGQEVLQFANAGIPVKEILADALAITVEEITQLQEEARMTADIVVPALVDALERDFADAAERARVSWVGMTNAIKGLIDLNLRTLFEPIVDELRPALLELIDKLNSSEFQNSIRAFGEEMSRGARALLDFLSEGLLSWDRFVQDLEDIRAFIDPIVDAVQQLHFALLKLDETLGWTEPGTLLKELYQRMADLFDMQNEEMERVRARHNDLIKKTQKQITDATEGLSATLAKISEGHELLRQRQVEESQKKIDKINADIEKNYASLADRITSMNLSATRRIEDQERTLAKRLQDINEHIVEAGQKLIEDQAKLLVEHTKKRERLEAQIAEKEVEFAEWSARKRLEIAQGFQRLLQLSEEKMAALRERMAEAEFRAEERRAILRGAMQEAIARGEDPTRAQQLLNKQLDIVQTELDAELAALQGRIDTEQGALDQAQQELQERADAEVAAEEEKHDKSLAPLLQRLADEDEAYAEYLARLQTNHDKQVAELEARLLKERALLDEQQAVDAARLEEDIANVIATNDRRLEELQERLDKEFQMRDEALDEIDAREERALQAARDANVELIARLRELIDSQEEIMNASLLRIEERYGRTMKAVGRWIQELLFGGGGDGGDETGPVESLLEHLGKLYDELFGPDGSLTKLSEGLFGPDGSLTKIWDTWVTETWPKIKEWTENVAARFSTWATDTWQTIQEWAANVTLRFGLWALETRQKVDEWEANVKAKINTWAHETWQRIQTWAFDVTLRFGLWTLETWQKVNEWEANVKAKINTWAHETWQRIQTWAFDVTARFGLWALETWQKVNEWEANVKAKINTWAHETWQRIQTWAADVTLRFGLWALENWQTFRNWISDVTAGFSLQSFWTSGQNIINGLIGGLNSVKQNLLNYFTSSSIGVINVIKGFFFSAATVSGAMYAAGRELLWGIYSGIISGGLGHVFAIYSAFTGGDGIITKIKNFFSVDKFIQQGKNILQGLLDGLNQAKSQIWSQFSSAIQSLFTNLPPWVKIILGIPSSPIPVGVSGENLVNNLITGINRRQGAFQRAITDLVGPGIVVPATMVGPNSLTAMSAATMQAPPTVQRSFMLPSGIGSRETSANFGDVNINNGMDLESFRYIVRQVLAEAL